jgi:cobalt-zinc-cadmium resistance protein CzcA
MVIIPIVIFLIYILLYLTFKSFKQALLVVGNIPFALIGGIAALWLRYARLDPEKCRCPIGGAQLALTRAVGG